MDNLILIGFMGSGKTSVGIRLSQILGWTFLDTDQLIEQEQGISISEIFREFGEEAFREMETQCLKKLLGAAPHRIISPGGGLPLREVNHGLLRQLGRTVYLRAEPETIYARLKDDMTRPLLRSDDPQARIRELMEQRKEIYIDASDYIVDVDNRTAEEIADEIVCLAARNGRKDENISNKRAQY